MDPFVNFRTEFPTFQHCLASQTSTCELEVRGVFDGLGKVDFCSENVTGKNFSCYRSQRSCGKVMFLHLSVILFGGVWQTHPSRRLPLQRTVRILLECILVSKEFHWIKIWGDSGGLSFDSGILPLLKHACGEQWLAIKRLEGVAPEVNVRVPTRPGKPGKMRVHLENLEMSWNFEKFNKYHGKMTWDLEKLGGY